MTAKEKKALEAEKALEAPTRLNYVGVKQIGSFWYSVKDKCTKSFATADECAKHFNSEE